MNKLNNAQKLLNWQISTHKKNKLKKKKTVFECYVKSDNINLNISYRNQNHIEQDKVKH